MIMCMVSIILIINQWASKVIILNWYEIMLVLRSKKNRWGKGERRKQYIHRWWIQMMIEKRKIDIFEYSNLIKRYNYKLQIQYNCHTMQYRKKIRTKQPSIIHHLSSIINRQPIWWWLMSINHFTCWSISQFEVKEWMDGWMKSENGKWFLSSSSSSSDLIRHHRQYQQP